MKKIILSVAFFLILAPAVRAESKVVASIQPIHSLVAAIMAGTETPALLLDGAASPHGYALKPSQVGLLDQAELIVWVAPELESFLNKPLRTLAEDTSVVTLMDIPELTIHPSNDHGHGHDHDSKHGNDPHIWLDPKNAARIIDVVYDKLVTLNPEHQALYQANTTKVQQRLEQLDAEIRTILTPVQSHSYMVFHNAFQYFTRHYGLQDAGVISDNPEVQPSVTEIQHAREYMREHHVRCLFIEPQFPANRVETVREGYDAKIGTLDPLGTSLAAGPELYFILMKNLAQTMRNCLG